MKKLTALIATLTLAASAARVIATQENEREPTKKTQPAKNAGPAKKAEATKEADEDEKPKGGWSADTWSGLELRGIGPAVTSGRVADIAVDPTDPKRWFVAVASGGVWKTENAGSTWTPVFDGEGSYSIGCVALDP